MAKLRNFHEAKWDEELIHELSVAGERGVLVPQPEQAVDQEPGSAVLGMLGRKTAPALPEINQLRVVRHYMRLSQEMLAVDNSIAFTFGTATMKYNPKVQEHVASRNPGITQIHPHQDPETMQGLLEIYYQMEQFIKEISGMDRVCLQSGAGAVAIFTGGSIMRSYHQSRGDHQRIEIITSQLSHPTDAASPATAGYKIINIMPGDDGLPDLEAVKAALSERTAGIVITNPEDSGIFNGKIDHFTKAVHDAGGLCFYDQANANAILGISRAKEAGFDMCFFNLHKTFSAPKGGFGPGASALAVREFLLPFLPVPRVERIGDKYTLDYDCPESIGRVRSFFGNAPAVVKAYMWIRQLGAEGLREAAITSVLNSNYLQKQVEKIPGVVIYYDEKRRLEQVRYSWKKLKEDTGVGTIEVMQRMMDFGIPDYFPSHRPWIVPEPFTLEPCESYNKDDLDEVVAVLRQCSKEAYESPEIYDQVPPFNCATRCVQISAGPNTEKSAKVTNDIMYRKTEDQVIIATYRKYKKVADNVPQT